MADGIDAIYESLPEDGGSFDVAEDSQEDVLGSTDDDEGEEVAESTESSTKASMTSKQANKAMDEQLFDFEYNGKVYKVTAENLIALAKKGAVQDSRAKTAGYMEKQVQELMAKMKNTDAMDSLRERGMTNAQIKEYMEQKYAEMLQEEQMSPEQRELKELKRFKEMQEKEQKTKAEREKIESHQAAIKKETETISKELAEVMATTDMPKHPLFAKFILQELMSAEAHGYKMPVKEAARLAELTANEQIGGFIQAMDVAKLKSVLSKEQIKALREDSMQQAKTNNGIFTNKKPIGVASKSGKPEKPETFDSFFKNLGR